MSLQDPISVPPHSNPLEPSFIKKINGREEKINYSDLTVSVNKYGRRFMSWKGHDIMSVNDYIYRINISRNKYLKDAKNEKLPPEKQQEASNKLAKIAQLKRHAREQNISIDVILDRDKIEAWSLNRGWIKFAYFFRSLLSDTVTETSRMNTGLVRRLNVIKQHFEHELKKTDLPNRAIFEQNVGIIKQVMKELASGEPLTEETQKSLKDLYDLIKASSTGQMTGEEITNKTNKILSPVKTNAISRKPIPIPNNPQPVTTLESEALTQERDKMIEEINTKHKEISQIQEEMGANRRKRTVLIEDLNMNIVQKRTSEYDMQKDSEVAALDTEYLALHTKYDKEDVAYQDLIGKINKLDTQIASLPTEILGSDIP